jgi:hypothetical protein
LQRQKKKSKIGLMAEEKAEQPSHQETSNLNEQTVPPEVEIEERGLAGKIIRQIKFHHQKIFFGLIGLMIVWAIVNVATRAYWLSRRWFRALPQPTPTPAIGPTASPQPTTIEPLMIKEKEISFRIDKDGEMSKVILINEEGQERILREYQGTEGPARKLYSSLENQFLAISLGTLPPFLNMVK